MRIRDISLAIRPGMVHWPGTTEVEVGWDARLAAGDPYDLSHWLLGAHSGTHVDAPSHFISGGNSILEINLGPLVGPARVVELADHVEVIDAEIVDALPLAGVSRILFRTSNEVRLQSDRFDPEYVAIAPSGAEALAARGTVAVGLDYLSVEPFTAPSPETHRVLLNHGIAIIEGLDLHDVRAGHYLLCCLPLALTGAEAAPARAVLVEDWDR